MVEKDNLNGIIESLVEEISENRIGVRGMLVDLEEKVTSKIEDLVPDTKDFRNRFAIENKTKVLSEILKLKLDLYKQIETSLKNEIEIRRKLDNKDDNSDYGSLDFIKAVAKSIEKLEKKDKKED